MSHQYVFPRFLKEASQNNFDFSATNERGQTVLQLAVLISYPDRMRGPVSGVSSVLKNVSNPVIDALSKSGSTAFHYTVNRCQFDDAKALLEAGANPFLYGAEDRDPMKQIDEHIKNYQEALTDDQYANRFEMIQQYIDDLKDIKEAALAKQSLKSHGEIRKNARMVAQLSRHHALFGNLPEELQLKIAASTGTPQVHTKDESEKIARSNLGKPQK